MSEREVNGRPFAKGHRNYHDVSAADRKGKANSPWRKGMSWLGGGGTERERIDRARSLPRNRGNNHA
jgi:hypothetical protein